MSGSVDRETRIAELEERFAALEDAMKQNTVYGGSQFFLLKQRIDALEKAARASNVRMKPGS